MFKKEYLEFLCCPDCRGDLSFNNKHLTCKQCKKQYPLIGEIPILLPLLMKDDVRLSQQKWEEEYGKTLHKNKMIKLKKDFENTYLESTMKYMRQIFRSSNNKKYLEIGCGPFFIGRELAKRGAFAVGIDYSMGALRLAKFYLEEGGLENYLLVCGDITKMPFKQGVFDLLYGGGVIEHFKDTVPVVKENFRVLKKGGVAFNTVPHLNLGSLTYRQVWGNIPNAPILKEIAELVHVKFLKGKYMTYGYEYSFTKKSLQKIFEKAGFKKKHIKIDRFEVPLVFEYIRSKILKNIATRIARSGLFWPVVYVQVKK
ncbi:MAG: methyltransferase domain-containing protein [Patescibacteria group bacterium]